MYKTHNFSPDFNSGKALLWAGRSSSKYCGQEFKIFAYYPTAFCIFKKYDTSKVVELSLLARNFCGFFPSLNLKFSLMPLLPKV